MQLWRFRLQEVPLDHWGSSGTGCTLACWAADTLHVIVYACTKYILTRFFPATQERHPDVVIPPVPELGTLDLRQVLHAPYFFS